LFYESHYPLGMHLGFRNRRRSQVTPEPSIIAPKRDGRELCDLGETKSEPEHALS